MRQGRVFIGPPNGLPRGLIAQRRRDVGERRVGHDERVLQQLGVVVDQVRDSAGLAAPGRRRSPGRRPRTAGGPPARPGVRSTTQTPQVRSLGREPLGDRDAAEDGRLAHLRQPDECQVAGEVQPAGETGRRGDRLVPAGARVEVAERPGARLADPELARRTSAANAASTGPAQRARRWRRPSGCRRSPCSRRQPAGASVAPRAVT